MNATLCGARKYRHEMTAVALDLFGPGSGRLVVDRSHHITRLSQNAEQYILLIILANPTEHSLTEYSSLVLQRKKL
jgi:hypothetical protein